MVHIKMSHGIVRKTALFFFFKKFLIFLAKHDDHRCDSDPSSILGQDQASLPPQSEPRYLLSVLF